MQALYNIDCSGTDKEKALDNTMGEEALKAETKDNALQLVSATLANIKDIDKEINGRSKGWPVNRMGAVDRNILRMAVCELLYMKDNPFAVVVDEAVELAKKYGAAESGKFINGVLASLSK